MVAALKTPITKKLRLNKSEMNEIARQIIQQNEAFIVGLNRGRLYLGEYTNEQKISPEYTPFTKSIKQGKGQPSDRVTLRDTGDFYQSIYVKANKDSFYTGATDPKTKELQEKYEDADSILLGLSEQDKDRFRKLTLKAFAQKYFEKLL